MYRRSEFDVLGELFINADEVNEEKKVTLQTAAIFTAEGCLQGFIRCQYKKSCSTNWCQCEKNGFYVTQSAMTAPPVVINKYFRSIMYLKRGDVKYTMDIYMEHTP